MRLLAVVLAVASVGLAWHGRAHPAASLTAALKGDCGSVSQCVRRKVQAGLAARGEGGNVRTYCPSAAGVVIVCDTVIDMTDDGDPVCFRYWIDWPSLRLVKSIDETRTRLCNDLIY